MQNDLPKLISTREFARWSQTTERTAREILHSPEGPPAVRIGRRLFVRADQLEEWLGRQAAAAAEKRLASRTAV